MWKTYVVIITSKGQYPIYKDFFFIQARNIKEATVLVKGRKNVKDWHNLIITEVPIYKKQNRTPRLNLPIIQTEPQERHWLDIDLDKQQQVKEGLAEYCTECEGTGKSHFYSIYKCSHCNGKGIFPNTILK